LNHLANDSRKLITEAGDALQTGSGGDVSAFLFDTKTIFEKWLTLLGRTSSKAASDCEVTFEGVLKVDGLWRNNIRSAYGTLVMTDQGRVEADIDVRIALIDGYFDGNLRASEQVVLERNARVSGNIHTPVLAIRDGAVFDGNSFVLGSNGDGLSEICDLHQQPGLSKASTAGV
jgi:cytoskeletal protein CcmA (bactofilin family)